MSSGNAKNTGKGGGDRIRQKHIDELNGIIGNYFKDENYKKFAEETKDFEGFYHTVYKILEELSEKNEAMQFKLPTKDTLKKKYTEVHKENSGNLTKDEFRKIIESVVSFDSFQVGSRAQNIFLFIFGIPGLALLAKRFIPGPTKLIPEDILIPVATSATVVVLAKTNQL